MERKKPRTTYPSGTSGRGCYGTLHRRRVAGHFRHEEFGMGQPGVGGSIIGVEYDRFAVGLQRATKPVLVPSVEGTLPQQKLVIGLGIESIKECRMNRADFQSAVRNALRQVPLATRQAWTKSDLFAWWMQTEGGKPISGLGCRKGRSLAVRRRRMCKNLIGERTA